MSRTVAVVLSDDVVSQLDEVRAMSRPIRTRSAVIRAALLEFLRRQNIGKQG